MVDLDHHRPWRKFFGRRGDQARRCQLGGGWLVSSSRLGSVRSMGLGSLLGPLVAGCGGDSIVSFGPIPDIGLLARTVIAGAGFCWIGIDLLNG